MFELQNFLPSPTGRMFSTILTTLQKIVFVLYFCLLMLNGSLFNFFNKFLAPPQSKKGWLSFLLHAEKDAFQSPLSIFTSHSCIRSVLMEDDSSVEKVYSRLSPFTQWHYLMIIRSSKLMAPFAYQLSLFVIPMLLGIVLTSFVKLLLKSFDNGITTWDKVRQKFPISHSTPMFMPQKSLRYVIIVTGLVITSLVMCLYTKTIQNNNESVCETPACFYCFPRFVRSIFKAEIDDFLYTSLSVINRLLCSSAIVIASLMLIFLVYAATILTGSLEILLHRTSQVISQIEILKEC
ncbi:uncharacterized protein LOC118183437 isoform X2 [Stegodyphus dumicola]|uniref:uncharacterized protein LOC118183437 isoform X2 n=1 Tax=Stegodyphus dumicola TaxID=202533 RepID=UPI0015B24A9F|nr:uncharacterized protein LOC118183437 isoform X2 [Stegodyphus dumicola]